MPVVKTSKEEILLKSTHLIWEQGYKNTSFSDLSKACGIRSAHFYYYFKDKEDLMTQILENSYLLFKEKIFSVAYRDELPANERLRLMMKKLNVFYLKNYGGCMFGNTVLEAAHCNLSFLHVVKQLFKEFIASLSHIYSTAMGPDEAQSRAVHAVEVLEGAIMMMRLFKDRSYIDKAWHNVML